MRNKLATVVDQTKLVIVATASVRPLTLAKRPPLRIAYSTEQRVARVHLRPGTCVIRQLFCAGVVMLRLRREGLFC